MPTADEQTPGSHATAQQWAAHCVAYRDMLFALSEAGTAMALEVFATPRGSEPGHTVLDIAALFDRLSRSVRMTIVTASRIDPDKKPPAPATAKPAPAKPPEPAPPQPPLPKAAAPAGDRGDRDSRDRLEDPMREHNLNRPVPELVAKVAGTFGVRPAAANPATPSNPLYYPAAAPVPPATPKPDVAFKPSG